MAWEVEMASLRKGVEQMAWEVEMASLRKGVVVEQMAWEAQMASLRKGEVVGTLPSRMGAEVAFRRMEAEVVAYLAPPAWGAPVPPSSAALGAPSRASAALGVTSPASS